MKSKLLLAITAGFLFCSTQQKAQVSNYSFTQTLSTYGSPSTGSLVGVPVQDEEVTLVNLPFTFTFNGVAHSTVMVGSNGHLSFDPSIQGYWWYDVLSDASTSEIIAPFSSDLFNGRVILGDMTAGSATLTNVTSTTGITVGTVFYDYLGDFSSNPVVVSVSGSNIVLNQAASNSTTGYPFFPLTGTLKQSVSGTSPNRIVEFEYANFTRLYSLEETLNFKFRLYETSNKIEGICGTMTLDINNADQVAVGLKGSSNSDYNIREVVSSTNTWSTTTAGTSINALCELDNTTKPIPGQSHMWTPVSCTVPVLGITASNTVSCAGSSVVLTATGATTYSWTNGGPATAQQTVSPFTTTTYTLVGANTTCTSSITYTQHVVALPILSISSSSLISCAGQSTSLTATGATSYSWNAVASTSQNVVSPTVTTTYSLTGSNGTCSTQQVYTQTVVAYPVLTVATTSTLFCVGQSPTITASGATTYSLNNVPATGTMIVSPVTSTTYTIAGSNGNCVSTKTISLQLVTDCATGIKEAGLESVGISAYPNPFGSALNIKNASENDLNVTITDALGKVIYNAKVKGQSVESISGDSLNSGLYFISVQGTNGTITKKLIKQ